MLKVNCDAICLSPKTNLKIDSQTPIYLTNISLNKYLQTSYYLSSTILGAGLFHSEQNRQKPLPSWSLCSTDKILERIRQHTLGSKKYKTTTSQLIKVIKTDKFQMYLKQFKLSQISAELQEIEKLLWVGSKPKNQKPFENSEVAWDPAIFHPCKSQLQFIYCLKSQAWLIIRKQLVSYYISSKYYS